MTGMLFDGHKSFSDHARYAWIYAERRDTYLQFLGNRIREADKQDTGITVVDYGTCDGGNILPIFESFSDSLKEEGPEKKLTCVFNDSDLSIMETLTRKIHESRLATERHVSLVTNTSDCYKQCLPKQSVDIAFCMFVLHWLSSPCPIKRGLFWPDSDEEENKVIKSKAEEDWINFLKNRTNELKPGGFLITALPGYGQECSDLPTNPRNVFRDMLTRNEISQEEFERTTIDIFMAKTQADIEKPFKNGSLKELCLLEVTCRTCYLKDDLGFTSDTIADYFKSWMFNGVMNGLSQERSLEEKKMVCDLYFEHLHNSFQNCDSSFESIGINLYECVIQKL